MRKGSVPRKVVLPDGALRRFHLPEPAELTATPRRRRRRVIGWVGLWLAFTLVCFHWSEGRLTPRSWVRATVSWLSAWRAPGASTARDAELTGSPTPKLSSSSADEIAIVTRPSLSAPPPPALSSHAGSFEPSLAQREEFVEAPPEGIQFGRTDSDGLEVHAGPGCERAKRRYRESFLQETEDPRVVSLLGDARRYRHCKAELMSLRLCALVHRGAAVGVTVQSEPPSRVVSTCAAIVAKTLHYPQSTRPQLVRTEIYFQ